MPWVPNNGDIATENNNLEYSPPTNTIAQSQLAMDKFKGYISTLITETIEFIWVSENVCILRVIYH
jgi:hypothetical protein